MPLIESLPYPPQRIISLVPSQTELLYDLGLRKRIIGITKFCIHPAEAVKNVTQVGGTKNFRFEVIDELQPDLIIGNKEENYQEGIERLASAYPVWISDIYTLEDALHSIKKIGELTGTPLRASQITAAIRQGFAALVPGSPVKVVYLIWKNPWMAAGSQTFIDDMLHRCGFTNALAHLPRYPVVTEEALRNAAPDYLFLSSEPYPFQEKHLAELEAICPAAKVILVDGEMFSWYGSRLLQATGYLNKLVYSL